MTKTPTFGFSAFLRLISLNEAPQKSAIRERYKPSSGKGYDYHRSLRLALQRLNSGSHSAADVLSSLSSIKKVSERHSAKRGIIRYIKWRKLVPGPVATCESVIFESPHSQFKVRFDADFVIELDGKRTAIHIWNTKGTKLSRSFVLAALSLVQANWPGDRDSDNDFAVLSLQDMTLYRWSDDPEHYQDLATTLVLRLDRLCRALMKEDGSTSTIGTTEPPSPSV
ncbi:hypothetical protein ACWGPT_08860 [Pseudorhizobium sp. NPDC055634]